MSTSPLPSGFRRRVDRLLMWLAVCLLLWLVSPYAQATPAFARQTGSSCADCHVGAYGPALTPYGMRFKMGGFTDTDGSGTKIPVAAQLTGTRGIPAHGTATTQLSEADIYLAGRISDYVGGYAKVASNNTGNDHFKTKLSNVDLRFVAGNLTLGGKSATVGVSVNNNPGSQDPIGVLPNASGLGPASAYANSTTLLNMSSLSDRVIGATVYALYDNAWYGEAGSYRSLSTADQDNLGYAIGGDPGKLSGTGYLRLAYMKDLKRQFFSAGVTALSTTRQFPRRTGPRDDITDLGYDLSYQFLGTREHILQASYLDIYERRRYGNPLADPGDPLLLRRRGSVRDQTLSLTYAFQQSYGLTLAHMINTGSHDPARYSPYGVPDTTSNLISVFWTPFGKDGSLTSIANLKVAATWFRFGRFNGSRTDIFGAPGTDAKDLDQFSLTASLAF